MSVILPGYQNVIKAEKVKLEKVMLTLHLFGHIAQGNLTSPQCFIL